VGGTTSTPLAVMARGPRRKRSVNNSNSKSKRRNIEQEEMALFPSAGYSRGGIVNESSYSITTRESNATKRIVLTMDTDPDDRDRPKRKKGTAKKLP